MEGRACGEGNAVRVTTAIETGGDSRSVGGHVDEGHSDKEYGASEGSGGGRELQW